MRRNVTLFEKQLRAFFEAKLKIPVLKKKKRHPEGQDPLDCVIGMEIKWANITLA